MTEESENSYRTRFTSWTQSLKQHRDWIAYRLTYPLTNYIAEETAYKNYLQRGHIVGNTRIYVSKAIFHALFIWLFISVLGGLLFTSFSAAAVIQELVKPVLAVTNLAFVIIGYLQAVLSGLIQFVNQNPDALGLFTEPLGLGDTESRGPILEQIITQIDLVVRENIVTEVVTPTVSDTVDMIQSSVSSFIISMIELVSSRLGVTLTPTGEEQSITQIVNSLELPLPGTETLKTVLTLVVAPLTGLVFLFSRLYYPLYIGGERKRSIQSNLPRSFTFMYALSEGGLGLVDIIHELADSEDAYQEVSVSFKKIARSIDRSDTDLTTTLQQVADETPSKRLEQFLREFASVIDTGSNIEEFFKNKSTVALEEARERQENYLQLFEILSEGYVIVFVASPIFILVLQLVAGLTGNLNRGLTQFIAYLGVPVGGFLVGSILYITRDIGRTSYQDLEIPVESHKVDMKRTPEQKLRGYKYIPYRLGLLWYKVRRVAYKPVKEISRQPLYSLFITVPLVIVYYIITIRLGYIPIEREAINSSFFEMTTFGYYIPLVLIALPISLLHEAKRRRRQQTSRQLPEFFRNIAQANKRGLTLQEALETTALSGEGQLYDTLRSAVRRSQITGNLNRGLVEFANRMRVPRLSQSIKLLVEANTVSSDVTAVVEIISEDLANLYELKQDRRQRARQYIAIVFISYFISAGVLFALDITFFTFVSNQLQQSAVSRGPGYGENLPIDFFRRVFMHTMMSLALVSGLVAGLMEDSNPLTGLKYAIIMSTAAVIGWFFII